MEVCSFLSLSFSLSPSLSTRLDNLIFAGDRPEVLAVLDWELSTLGDPISDLAYCCMPYHLRQNQPSLKGRLKFSLTVASTCAILNKSLLVILWMAVL